MKVRVRSAEFGARICFIVLFLITCHASLDAAPEKWPGVDEKVVERIAREHGREAREPFINTDQGDLLLFAFLLAGVVGGFAGGYYWRVLMERRVQGVERHPGVSEPTKG